MILHKADYGVKKGIPTTLIAASSFDDIIAITVFSVFLSIGINSAPVPASEDPLIETEAEVDGETASGLRMLAGSSDEPKPIWWEIGFNVVQFILGLFLAFGVGYLMKFCNKCDKKVMKWPKFFFCLWWALAVPVLSDMLGWPEVKFVAVIFFGYNCYKYWGDDKPEHEFAIFWMFCQPFLFGTVGAAVMFSKIEVSQIGLGFAVILIGVTARWLGTFFAAFEKKYTIKERAFMAFAWIPKATVQAALGGLALMKSKEKGLGPEYLEWGQAMLTTAVFAICLTAPLGAIFINTLGTKWLNYDGDVNMSMDPYEEGTVAESKIASGNEAGSETNRENTPGSATVVPVKPEYGTNESVRNKDEKSPIIEDI